MLFSSVRVAATAAMAIALLAGSPSTPVSAAARPSASTAVTPKAGIVSCNAPNTVGIKDVSTGWQCVGGSSGKVQLSSDMIQFHAMQWSGYLHDVCFTHCPNFQTAILFCDNEDVQTPPDDFGQPIPRAIDYVYLSPTREPWC